MSYQDFAQQTAREPIEIVEIEVERCGLSFGTGICYATGEPCYNTWATCRAPDVFASEPYVYRFAKSDGNVPLGLSCVSLLKNISTAPQQLTVGKGLGVRASVTIQMRDADWPDHDHDPYFDARGHGAAGAAGTFWGRWLARHRFYVGRFARIYTGYVGSVWPLDFECRSYVIDSVNGVDKDGNLSLICKDILKLADDKRAQCPRASTTRLSNDISATDTTINLYPSTGDQLAASGFLRISSEIMSYTRSGDVLTVVRGQRGTVAKDASADDSVQDCAVFVNEPVQDIIYSLLNTYAGIPAAYIDKSAWDTERDEHLLGVYSSIITEPVGVNTLIAELCEQGQCYIWWDDVAQQIRFKALVPPVVDGLPIISDELHQLADSMSKTELANERQSRFVIYFDPIDPTKSLTDRTNFRQCEVVGDPLSESALEHGSPRIKTINSRWFSAGSLGRVRQLGQALLRRYRDPPRQIDFMLDASVDLKTADIFRVSSRLIQAPSGARDLVTMQVIEQQAVKAGVRNRVKALSFDWAGSDVPVDPLIYISVDLFDVDLVALYEAEYGTPDDRHVTFIVMAGVLITSSSISTPALITGSWITPPTLIIRGTVAGRGGNGGRGGDVVHVDGGMGEPVQADDGQDGGDAIRADSAITIVIDPAGIVCGGFGGGGGGGGAWRSTPANRGVCGSGGGGGWPYGAAGAKGERVGLVLSTPDGLDGYSATRDNGGDGASGYDSDGYIGGAGGDGGDLTRSSGDGLGGATGGDPNTFFGVAGLQGQAFINDHLITLTNNGLVLEG